jgi:hypothetical protein
MGARGRVRQAYADGNAVGERLRRNETSGSSGSQCPREPRSDATLGGLFDHDELGLAGI